MFCLLADNNSVMLLNGEFLSEHALTLRTSAWLSLTAKASWQASTKAEFFRLQYTCAAFLDKHFLATVNSWQMFPAAISCMMFLSENHRLGIHGFADWDLSLRPFAWVCWLKYMVQEHGYKWKCWMQNVQNTFRYQNPMLCFRQPSILPALTIANYKHGLAVDYQVTRTKENCNAFEYFHLGSQILALDGSFQLVSLIHTLSLWRAMLLASSMTWKFLAHRFQHQNAPMWRAMLLASSMTWKFLAHRFQHQNAPMVQEDAVRCV